MKLGIEEVTKIAMEAFCKVVPPTKASNVEVEEIEEDASSGTYHVTLGYWSKDNKPQTHEEVSLQLMKSAMSRDFLNPWRRKYKRVEVDPEKGKAVSIKMYEPPLGVS